MILIHRILDILALIGRYGTQGFVASLFVGLALPQLAAAARPLLGVAIFTFVMMTFMRVDPRALRGLIRHPARLILTCVCLILAPAAVGYAVGTTPWGGHPSTTLADIQSGQGWVHNSCMLEGIDKCVVRGPLTSPFRPLWSPLHRTCHLVGRELCGFEADPDVWRLSKLGFQALRG